jgi:tRNA U38,U39,U40 pseudouridine synthase TruA
MNYYKAIIQYDGSECLGFQWQEGVRTIQGDLILSLEKILEGEFTPSVRWSKFRPRIHHRLIPLD